MCEFEGKDIAIVAHFDNEPDEFSWIANDEIG